MMVRKTLLNPLVSGALLGVISLSVSGVSGALPAAAAPLIRITGAPQATPVTQAEAVSQSVVVAPGDTLSLVAAQLGVSWPALAAWNQLADPNLIYPGQRLVAPPAGWAPPVASATQRIAGQPVAPPRPTSTLVVATPSRSASPAPGQAQTSAVAGGGFQACVISRESGGNPSARNGQYWGLYQFSPSTWAAYGGSPASFGSASAAAQTAVFNRAVAAGGQSNWAPYDHC